MRRTALAGTLAMVGFSGCGTGVADDVMLDTGEVLAVDDGEGTVSQELTAGVGVGATLRTTGNLNLRTGPGLSHSIRLVMPRGSTVTTINRGQPEGGWYNVRHHGTEGWSYGGYLELVQAGGAASTPPPPAGSSSKRDEAIARAKSGVGYSYWWGHARWVPEGLSSGTRGYCSGSCPSCSHSGANGADCSGYVGKIWQVPGWNDDPRTDSHPYSTINFVAANALWDDVSRSNIRRGDAFVYNQNGAGHIFLYESGDAWGSVWAYEAKGCAYGIVHDLRTVPAVYKGIRRAGF